jgi:hypothetical protein
MRTLSPAAQFELDEAVEFYNQEFLELGLARSVKHNRPYGTGPENFHTV